MTEREDPTPLSYARAGVDVLAAEKLVSRFAELAKMARRPEVLADIGPFSGLFKLGSYREPVLVASTDSVGTKVKLAILMERYDTIGRDLVNHCVNDIFTAGAEPLFFLDYIGGSGVTDDAKLELVRGLVAACREANCALLGGETADLPGLYADGDFDLVGFIVGVAEKDGLIDGSQVMEGDALLALPSSGLHTNGYSLVRRLFDIAQGGDPDAERARMYQNYPGLGTTLGEELLRPHRCYYNDLKPALPLIRGMAHITGGGLPGNVPRMLPEGLAARIDRSSWRPQPLFQLIQREGNIPDDEMFRAFNMGLGMVMAVRPDDISEFRLRAPEATVVGEVLRQRDDTRFSWR